MDRSAPPSLLTHIALPVRDNIVGNRPPTGRPFNGQTISPAMLRFALMTEGNTLVLWTKGGSDPVVPEGWTRE